MHIRVRFLHCLFPALLVAFTLPTTASAKVIGMNAIAKPVNRERIATLPKKQQKAWLEYLERSEKQKAIDKQTLADEQKAAGNSNPKHASGGRGMFALRGDHPAEWFASDEALKDARNIVTWQVADGGWSKNIDMVTNPRAPGDLYDANNENRFPDLADFDKPVDPSWHYIATLDNDSTWMQIRFLARVATALLGGASRCRRRAHLRIRSARRGVPARFRVSQRRLAAGVAARGRLSRRHHHQRRRHDACRGDSARRGRGRAGLQVSAGRDGEARGTRRATRHRLPAEIADCRKRREDGVGATVRCADAGTNLGAQLRNGFADQRRKLPGGASS